MNFGFVKIACATPFINVADCFFNAKEIIKNIKIAHKNEAFLVNFPELCITGYTCNDLFFQKALINDCKAALKLIIEETKNLNITFVVGMPVEYENKLFNCGVVIYNGKILGIVPKTHLANYNEFYEKRYFSSALKDIKQINFLGQDVYFGTKILFCPKHETNLKFGIEICEDLWSFIPPSSYHTIAGATLILNLSSSNEVILKNNYRKNLISVQSSKNICAYAYASSGEGESTSDLVFSAHNIIAENGNILTETEKFKNDICYAYIDFDHISNERRKYMTFEVDDTSYLKIEYEIEKTEQKNFNRLINKTPFIPTINKDEVFKDTINIQAYGLKKRIEYIDTKTIVIGISGGLDSTHALLVAAKTFEILGYDKKNILAVTMPCFGTTDRTLQNAKKLCNLLGTSILEINIKNSVLKHFEDIGQDPNKHDLTFENSQARERTQILMDIASKQNGFVVGTGDLSELALGFATYNGDHMSMYNVNASIPKTLIKHLINYLAKNCNNNDLKQVLLDILQTPVSPELLPPKNKDQIFQVTEDIIGSYYLHDFFLYNAIKLSFEPEKVYYLAKVAFKDEFDEEYILNCLKTFYKKFFNNQFKRSCMPDAPKVTPVSLSPRGDFRMPSDASSRAFLNRLEKL